MVKVPFPSLLRPFLLLPPRSRSPRAGRWAPAAAQRSRAHTYAHTGRTFRSGAGCGYRCGCGLPGFGCGCRSGCGYGGFIRVQVRTVCLSSRPMSWTSDPIPPYPTTSAPPTTVLREEISAADRAYSLPPSRAGQGGHRRRGAAPTCRSRCRNTRRHPNNPGNIIYRVC